MYSNDIFLIGYIESFLSDNQDNLRLCSCFVTYLNDRSYFAHKIKGCQGSPYSNIQIKDSRIITQSGGAKLDERDDSNFQEGKMSRKSKRLFISLNKFSNHYDTHAEEIKKTDNFSVLRITSTRRYPHTVENSETLSVEAVIEHFFNFMIEFIRKQIANNASQPNLKIRFAVLVDRYKSDENQDIVYQTGGEISAAFSAVIYSLIHNVSATKAHLQNEILEQELYGSGWKTHSIKRISCDIVTSKVSTLSKFISQNLKSKISGKRRNPFIDNEAACADDDEEGDENELGFVEEISGRTGGYLDGVIKTVGKRGISTHVVQRQNFVKSYEEKKLLLDYSKHDIFSTDFNSKICKTFNVHCFFKNVLISYLHENNYIPFSIKDLNEENILKMLSDLVESNSNVKNTFDLFKELTIEYDVGLSIESLLDVCNIIEAFLDVTLDIYMLTARKTKCSLIAGESQFETFLKVIRKGTDYSWVKEKCITLQFCLDNASESVNYFHCLFFQELYPFYWQLQEDGSEPKVRFFCDRCYQIFKQKLYLIRHKSFCKSRLKYPNLKFKTSEFLTYSYGDSKKYGKIIPFSINFDVETYNDGREDSDSPELKLASYQVSVSSLVPGIKDFYLYRSMNNKSAWDFDISNYPNKLKPFLQDLQDVNYRVEYLEKQTKNEDSFSQYLVSDIFILGSSMQDYVMSNQYEFLKITKLDYEAILQETIDEKKPCNICNRSFASYESKDKLKKGGLSLDDFLNELQNCFTMYQKPYLIEGLDIFSANETAIIKNNEFINSIYCGILDISIQKAFISDFASVAFANLSVKQLCCSGEEVDLRVEQCFVYKMLCFRNDYSGELKQHENQVKLSLSKLFIEAREAIKKDNSFLSNNSTSKTVIEEIDQFYHEYFDFFDNINVSNNLDFYVIHNTHSCDINFTYPNETFKKKLYANLSKALFVLLMRFFKVEMKHIKGQVFQLWDLENKFYKCFFSEVFFNSYRYICKFYWSETSIHHDHDINFIYGLTHQTCNTKVRFSSYETRYINVFSHNSSFDNTYILKGMPKNLTNYKGSDISSTFNLVGSSVENNRLIYVGPFVFKDSYQLFVNSVDGLLGSMKEKERKKFVKEVSKYFLKNGILDRVVQFKGRLDSVSFSEIQEFVFNVLFTEEIDKVTNEKIISVSKAPVPYEAITSPEYSMRTDFPPISDFYSNLKNAELSEEKYDYGKKQFVLFGDRTFEDYLHRYNFIDVAGMNVIFAMRAMEFYTESGIDLRACCSMSQYSYLFMLKNAKRSLELLSNEQQLTLLNENIRAGLSNTTKRYSISTFCFEDRDFKTFCYDAATRSHMVSLILILDENNQYGGAQCRPMGDSGYKLHSKVTVEEIHDLLHKIHEEGLDVGFVGRFNLHLPDEKHNEYLIYPIGIVKGSPHNTWLGPYQLKNLRKPSARKGKFNQLKIEPKLYPTLFDLNNYVVGHDLLNYMLTLGYEIKNVLEVLEFKTEPYIREYVIRNQNLRMKTKDPVYKKLNKDKNNLLYGRFGMKVEDHCLKTVVYDCKKSVEVVSDLCEKSGESNPHFSSVLGNDSAVETDVHNESTFIDNNENDMGRGPVMEDIAEQLVSEGIVERDNDNLYLLDNPDASADGRSVESKRKTLTGSPPKEASEYESVDKILDRLINQSHNLKLKIFNQATDNNGSDSSVSAIVDGLPKPSKKFKNLRCNAPIILDNAKISISKFCYNFEDKICNNLPSNFKHPIVNLCATDTDSAFLHISAFIDNANDRHSFQSEIFKIMYEKLPLVDFGNTKDSKLLGQYYTAEKNKKFGHFQLEYPKRTVLELPVTAIKEYMTITIPEGELMKSDNVEFMQQIKTSAKHTGLSHKFAVGRDQYIKRLTTLDDDMSAREKVSVAGFRNINCKFLYKTKQQSRLSVCFILTLLAITY